MASEARKSLVLSGPGYVDDPSGGCYITYHTTSTPPPAGREPAAGGRGPVIGGGALVTTEKQKIKPKTNKLSKRDALQHD